MKTARKYLPLALVLFFTFAILGLATRDLAIAAGDGSSKIETALLERVSVNGSADFIMQFTPQADLSAAYSMDWDARGEYVYDTLKETASLSQASAKALLDAQGLAYQTFIAGNELYVWGDIQATANGLTVLDELAALPEVSSIRLPRTYSIDPGIETNAFGNSTWAGDLLAEQRLATEAISTTAIIAWGIQDTKADQFWTDYGHRGEGIVVANIDTGVQWNHPGLDQAFKCGTNPSDPACWYDPTNRCGGSACDDQGHGTHTMGTMVADNDPTLPFIAGMAPGAKWIACKGCETTECSEYALNSCADWILAPADNPANRPDIVNNSWGGDGGGDSWYLPKVNAWRAAGIFPAFSAGNTGPGCNTLGSPGDYQESFASAAHNINRNIASFSSRGPSTFGHDPYTKPNLSAPGVDICSTVISSGWSCYYSGTSMASPHTAGAVALLWSCNPSLKGQVDTTFQLLQNSADPAPAGTCGAPLDGLGNNTFGYGYLDVLAAGKSVCGVAEQSWIQYSLPPGCPDWTRFDGEYYSGTGKVYFMGGRDGANGDITYGDIYAYDPDTNTCADTSVDMPVPISNYTIARVNNGSADLLCTFGGRSSGGVIINNVQCFNPNDNSISSVSTLPGNLGSYLANGVAVVNNKVYVFGGFNDGASPSETAQTWEWDPTSNLWTQKGDLSLGRAYIDTAVVDGKIFAFGGDVYAGTSLVAQTRAEVFNPTSGLWDDAGVLDLPSPTGEGVAFGFDSASMYELAGKLIIAGGGQWPNESAEVFQYNVASNAYSDTFTNLSVSRANQAGFFVQGNPGRMWVFGGRSKEAGYGDNNPPYAPLEYYPVDLAYQDVVVPTRINLTLMQGASQTTNLIITNRNSFPLNWTLTTSASAGISNNTTPFVPVVTGGGVVNDQITTHSPDHAITGSVPEVAATGLVLWDQPLSSYNQLAYVDQDFPDYPQNTSFLADDFVSGGWTITSIYVPGDGWSGFTSLAQATGLTWQIYADAAGKPAGSPAGGALPVWSLSLLPTDSQVTLSPGTPSGLMSTVKLSLNVPLVLPPGHYWLVFYPSLPYTYGQYGRQPSDTINGYVGKFINPGNGFGYGTDWQDWTVLGSQVPDIAFRIEGEIPWISVDPVEGTVPAGGTQQVTATLNSSGLAPGVYTAGLLFTTSDPDRPLISIPVRLSVSNGVVYLPLSLKH